jgi:predicted transcriptional regulator
VRTVSKYPDAQGTTVDGLCYNLIQEIAMRNAVTVSLPEALTQELDLVSREAGTSRSEIVREALKKYFALREYRALRAELVLEAEAKGIVTDEDVFDQVS